MFRVRTTVIESVMLAATVVCCTLIKHRENLICSLVFLIYLTIRMWIILKSENAVYHQSPQYVYEGSFFIWHNRPILLMRQIEAYGFIELIRYPAEVGALFTTVPVLGLVGLGLPLLLRLGLALWLVSGIALNKYCCE